MGDKRRAKPGHPPTPTLVAMDERGVAIQQWQRSVVAIGVRRGGDAVPDLVGTGFIVDLPAGLVSTCAHVALAAFYDFLGPLDPGIQGADGGLAVGFGTGEQIKWVCRADIKHISRPPASYYKQFNKCLRCGAQLPPLSNPGPNHRQQSQACTLACWNALPQHRLQFRKGPPPTHWAPHIVHDADALDLAILQLTSWDGVPLSEQLCQPADADADTDTDADAAGLPLLQHWPRCLLPEWPNNQTVEPQDATDEQLALLRYDLACALLLGDVTMLRDGVSLVMLGYGQDHTGGGSERTSTTTRGCFSGNYVSATEGVWLKSDVMVLSGHSGGPVLNRGGEAVGWAVKSATLGQLRPIEKLFPALEAVLAAVAPDRVGPHVKQRLQGHLADAERRDLDDDAAWNGAQRFLDASREAASRAEQAAEQASGAVGEASSAAANAQASAEEAAGQAQASSSAAAQAQLSAAEATSAANASIALRHEVLSLAAADAERAAQQKRKAADEAEEVARNRRQAVEQIPPANCLPLGSAQWTDLCAPPRAAVVPHSPQLAPDVHAQKLFGRGEEAKELYEALSDATAPRKKYYLVMGAAGLGKTALVEYVGRSLVAAGNARFSAIVFVELRAEDTREKVFRAVDDALRGAGLSHWSELKDALVILDNADDPYKEESNKSRQWFEGPSEDALLPRLEACAPAALLVTMRDEGHRTLFARSALSEPPAFRQKLEPLPREAGLKMLHHLTQPAAKPALNKEEEEKLLEACGLRGVSPLALSVVCGVLRSRLLAPSAAALGLFDRNEFLSSLLMNSRCSFAP